MGLHSLTHGSSSIHVFLLKESQNPSMPGQIKRMIHSIVAQRSNGNPTIALTTKTKLVLKGINPDRFTDVSEDDPAVMAKLHVIANELGVRL
jgi:hypothetical protein